MGITIYSKNLSYNLGPGGFCRLRKTIAGLCPDEIRDHYVQLADHYFDLRAADPGFVHYDMGTEQIYQKYRKKYGKVIDFLYASNVDCSLTYGTARQLLDLIGDYDDDIVYGYAGWGDKAMRFRNFRAILEDACKTRKKWGWK